MGSLSDFRDNALSGIDGDRMYALAERLYPICRSITGNGVRETLRIVSNEIPLDIVDVPSGTRVFDWTVPDEWNIREAWIKGPDGSKIVDFAEHNLHVVSYSRPIQAKLTLDKLLPHLHSLDDRPDVIPYRTTYYDENWGFCLRHSTLESLGPGEYEVFIDATLEPGSLTYGELFLPGISQDEILLSAHTCHPSLANDNLSGIAVLVEIARAVSELPRSLGLRFIFAPGTIGSITWLAQNSERTSRIRHGLVVSCVGDAGGPLYKRSRRGNAAVDQAMEYVLNTMTTSPVVEDFSPYGYDERQYCSPGFNLPVGLFERSKYGAFPEYHTSEDNLEFISAGDLAFSAELLTEALNILQTNTNLVNIQPHCEPQLGKRGLYQAMGGDNDRVSRQMAMLWLLNLSDGQHSLLEVADRSGIPYSEICSVADVLIEHELLKR